MDKFLIKLGRFSAWALLGLMLIYIITGYGMLKGIIDPVFSRHLHNTLLPIPIFIFFVLHVCISTKHALTRWRIFKTSKTANIYALVLGLIMLILFFWLYLL